MKPSGPRVDHVAVKFVDRRVELAAADERIELAIIEEHVHRTALLIGVVAADHACAGAWIVRRADARQQQQPRVAEAIRTQDHDARRLLHFVAARVDVGDAGGLPPGGIRVDAQHVAQRAQLERRLPRQRRVHRRQWIGLGTLRADMARAETAERAFEHLHAVQVAVVLRHRRGWALERHIAQRAHRVGEQPAFI